MLNNILGKSKIKNDISSVNKWGKDAAPIAQYPESYGYKGWKKNISPQDFLRLAMFEEMVRHPVAYGNLKGYQQAVISPSNVKRLKPIIASKTKEMDMPWIETHGLIPVGHEGRHRAVAAMELGQSTIPVYFVDTSSRFQKERKEVEEKYKGWPESVRQRYEAIIRPDKSKDYIYLSKSKRPNQPEMYTYGKGNIFISKLPSYESPEHIAKILGHEELHKAVYSASGTKASAGLDKIQGPDMWIAGQLANPKTSKSIFVTQQERDTAVKKDILSNPKLTDAGKTLVMNEYKKYYMHNDNESKNMVIQIDLKKHMSGIIRQKLIKEGFDIDRTMVHGTSLENAQKIKQDMLLKSGTYLYPGRGGMEDARVWSQNSFKNPRVIIVQTPEKLRTEPLSTWVTVGKRAEERQGLDTTYPREQPITKIRILKHKGESQLEEDISENYLRKNNKLIGFADGKPVLKLSKGKYPSLHILNTAYSHLDDDRNVPVVLETRKHYLMEYVKNQEKQKGVKFTKHQKDAYMKEELAKLKNVATRFTTYHNKYMPPRVVIFPDKGNNKKEIISDINHEYGHELEEKKKRLFNLWKQKFNNKTSPTIYGTTNSSEDFAESYALYKGKNITINNPNAKVKERLEFFKNNIQRDNESKDDSKAEIDYVKAGLKPVTMVAGDSKKIQPLKQYAKEKGLIITPQGYGENIYITKTKDEPHLLKLQQLDKDRPNFSTNSNWFKKDSEISGNAFGYPSTAIHSHTANLKNTRGVFEDRFNYQLQGKDTKDWDYLEFIPYRMSYDEVQKVAEERKRATTNHPPLPAQHVINWMIEKKKQNPQLSYQQLEDEWNAMSKEEHKRRRIEYYGYDILKDNQGKNYIYLKPKQYIIDKSTIASVNKTAPGHIFIDTWKQADKWDEKDIAEVIAHEELHNILEKEAGMEASRKLDVIQGGIVQSEQGRILNPSMAHQFILKSEKQKLKERLKEKDFNMQNRPTVQQIDEEYKKLEQDKQSQSDILHYTSYTNPTANQPGFPGQPNFNVRANNV